MNRKGAIVLIHVQRISLHSHHKPGVRQFFWFMNFIQDHTNTMQWTFRWWIRNDSHNIFFFCLQFLFMSGRLLSVQCKLAECRVWHFITVLVRHQVVWKSSVSQLHLEWPVPENTSFSWASWSSWSSSAVWGQQFSWVVLLLWSPGNKANMENFLGHAISKLVN